VNSKRNQWCKEAQSLARTTSTPDIPLAGHLGRSKGFKFVRLEWEGRVKTDWDLGEQDKYYVYLRSNSQGVERSSSPSAINAHCRVLQTLLLPKAILCSNHALVEAIDGLVSIRQNLRSGGLPLGKNARKVTSDSNTSEPSMSDTQLLGVIPSAISTKETYSARSSSTSGTTCWNTFDYFCAVSFLSLSALFIA